MKICELDYLAQGKDQWRVPMNKMTELKGAGNLD
jgi:hypothetical protein